MKTSSKRIGPDYFRVESTWDSRFATLFALRKSRANPGANLSATYVAAVLERDLLAPSLSRLNRAVIQLREFQRSSRRTESAFHRTLIVHALDRKPAAIHRGTTGMHGRKQQR
jgi:hypothetical protein